MTEIPELQEGDIVLVKCRVVPAHPKYGVRAQPCGDHEVEPFLYIQPDSFHSVVERQLKIGQMVVQKPPKGLIGRVVAVFDKYDQVAVESSGFLGLTIWNKRDCQPAANPKDGGEE